jgi:hypothetical protein
MKGFTAIMAPSLLIYTTHLIPFKGTVNVCAQKKHALCRMVLYTERFSSKAKSIGAYCD